jgi:GH24 family phage-related lysozyme (muramidase)
VNAHLRYASYVARQGVTPAMKAVRLLILAALAALTVSGCGARSPLPSSSGDHPLAQPGTQISPASCTADAPPCTAIVPEGARGADRSHYYNPPSATVVHVPLTLTLTGSGIQLDPFGASFVEGFENIYEAWYCPFYDGYGHVWTRAFGETDWSGNFGGVCISHEQAERNLVYLMDTQYLYAVRDLDVSLNHHQVDALASFVWNLGPGSMGWQPLRSELQRHDPYGMLGYDIAGGAVLSGLAERRRREVDLFLAPDHEAPLESPAQRRRREVDELRGHERELARLRIRQRVLRRELASKGCYPRLKAHRAGPTCRRFKREGNEVSARGRQEDTFVAKLRRDLR